MFLNGTRENFLNVAGIFLCWNLELIFFKFLRALSIIFDFAYHESYNKGVFLLFPRKNTLVRNSGKEWIYSMIKSIPKSNYGRENCFLSGKLLLKDQIFDIHLTNFFCRFAINSKKNFL